MEADYYGFFHYRRYLSFSKTNFETDCYKNIYCEGFSDEFIQKFCLDEKSISEFIGDNDLIVPCPMDFTKDPTLKKEFTVRAHYEQSPGHNIKDFDFALDYIQKNCPEFYPAAVKYSESRYGYFLNMFIMKKELFMDYCAWLFPILDAFDKQRDYTYASTFEMRTCGLLSERLFGIWLTHLLENDKNIKIKYAQQIFIQDTQNPYPLPFKSENNVPICIAADDNYAPFAGNVIQSIIENSSSTSNYDIFVISNGIQELNKELLKNLVEGRKNFSLNFINGKKYINNRNLFERNHITRSCYLRFAMLDFLRNYKKAIYLDCDLVVNKDIADFYNFDIADNYFGAVRDSVQSGWCNINETGQKKYNIEELKLDTGYEYFNSGVMIFNLDEIRKKYTAEDLYKLAESRKWMWQDQDVLNYIGKGKTAFLPQEWNVMVHFHKAFNEMPEYWAPKAIFEGYKSARKNPSIIHYCGRALPCFCDTADLAWYFWKYAMQTPFFDAFFAKMAQEKASKESKVAIERSRIKTFLRKVFDKLAPIGTKRRSFARKIYHRLFR